MRSLVTELSRKRLDEQIVLTKYKAGYAEITVKSRFNGSEALEDLFYEIVQNKFSTATDECYNSEAVGLHDTSASLGGIEE